MRARKRARITTAATPSTAALRAALATRCCKDYPPGAWRCAAAAVGISGADAFLRHLSSSFSSAIESLASSTEAARAQLQSVREARAADVGATPLCDELEMGIDEAVSSKRVALERELCAVDSVLGQIRVDRIAVKEAAASLSDAELIAHYTKLTARLDAAEAQLLILPTAVVDPPFVGLVVGELALLAGNAIIGRVVAPRAIPAAELAIECASSCALRGCNLLIRLVMKSAHSASQPAEELKVALEFVAAATHVKASLAIEGVAPEPVRTDVSADLLGRCIVISTVVPATAPVGSSVCFGPLVVSGHPVAGMPSSLRVKVGWVCPMTNCAVTVYPQSFSLV